MRDGLSRGVPVLVGVLAVALWEAAVRFLEVPSFVVPAPTAIVAALATDAGPLAVAAWRTLLVTAQAFALALAGGVALAALFVWSPLAERALFPYTVILQVTPVVSIAPLVILWVGFDHVERAQLILAVLVAFFPILSNTTLGLKSVDRNLVDLFRLHGASRRQELVWLRLPAALPHLLAGMKISGGLALIGAVVAEFVAGSGTSTGLAWRILESGHRLNIPRMFAALLMLSALGLAIFVLLGVLERRLLSRWHESALGPDA